MKRTFLNSHPNRLFVFISISLVTIFVFTVDCMARLGGGDGFSSGGSYSSGGRYGGGDAEVEGLFYLMWILLRLTFRYPFIGIPICLVVGVALFIYIKLTTRFYHTTHTIRKASQLQQRQATSYFKDADTSAIQAKDPDFSPSDFKIRCKNLFLKAQKAWSDQDMRPVRTSLSDGIYERFQAHLQMQKASLLKNQMDDMRVLKCQIIETYSDSFFDTIHVQIVASASDYYVHSETLEKVYGNTHPNQFTEYWSFLRRPGVKTKKISGPIEDQCPNCGYVLTLSDSCICPSCSSVINSGEYDWVLAEITQEGEWRGRNATELVRFDDIAQKDPAFNAQHVEDRVSVMFWRLRQSEFFADPNYVGKLAHQHFLDTNKKSFQATESGQHKFFADAAVGSVNINAIELSKRQNPDEFDKLSVHVRWMGHPEEQNIPSLIPPAFEQSRRYEHEFILARKSSTKTSTKNTLTSSHCAECGAPETINTGHSCDYCGATLNDGSLDWVLYDVKPYRLRLNTYEPTEEDRQKRTLSEPNPTDLKLPAFSQETNVQLIQCLIAMMLTDGAIDNREQKWLNKMAKNRKIPSNELAHMIQSVKQGNVKPSVPQDKNQARIFCQALVLMCLADGKVDAKERKLLETVLAPLGYVKADIKMQITIARDKLYNKARQQLKDHKRRDLLPPQTSFVPGNPQFIDYEQDQWWDDLTDSLQ